MTEGYNFSLSTFRGGGSPRSQSQIFLGGSQVSDFWGGPRSQIFGGGSQVSDFWGGPRGLRFSGGAGGSQVSDFQGGPRSQILGGVPSLRKGKIF